MDRLVIKCMMLPLIMYDIILSFFIIKFLIALFSNQADASVESTDVDLLVKQNEPENTYQFKNYRRDEFLEQIEIDSITRT